MKYIEGSLEWVDALGADVKSALQKVVDEILLKYPHKMVGLAVFHEDMRYLIIKPTPTSPVSLSKDRCIHATVLDRDLALVVQDAHSDRHWMHHPQVAGGMQFSSFCLVALRNSGGSRIGALSLLDTNPDPDFTPSDSDYLVECGLNIENILFGNLKSATAMLDE